MKNIIFIRAALTGSLLLSSFALMGSGGPVCDSDHSQYAASLEAVRLKNDFDPMGGASDLCIRLLYSPEGAARVALTDDRPVFRECIDIQDDELNQFIQTEDNSIRPFEKGSGKIQVSALVDEVDFGLPRFSKFPMRQSNFYQPARMQWGPSDSDSYDQLSRVVISNDNVDLRINLYRRCATY